MTKIDIVSGFLGAGKTTLIKKMVKEAYQGEKLVLIENEFGEISIDGGFLKESGVQISEMSSGCICCSLVGDFGKALKDVEKQFHPDRILIEPSGVGKLSDVIGAVLPEILPMVGFDQRNPHHCYDVWEHTLHALDAAPSDSMLRWAVLFHDMGKPECFALDTQGIGHFMGHGVVSRRIADGVMDRLRFDNAAKERIGELVACHDHRVETERGIRRMLNRFGERNFRYLLAIQRADNMGQAEEFRGRQKEIDRIEAMLDRELEKGSCFSLKQLAVNGNDLLGLGLSGPAVGRTLQGLLDRVMDGTLPNDRDALLTAAGKIR